MEDILFFYYLNLNLAAQQHSPLRVFPFYIELYTAVF